MLTDNLIGLFGCGESILTLNYKQKDLLNSLTVSYGINLFSFFCDEIDIYPKTTWFTDTAEPSPKLLEYILMKKIQNKKPKKIILPSSMIQRFKTYSWLGKFGFLFPFRCQPWYFHRNYLCYILHKFLMSNFFTCNLYRISRAYYLPTFISAEFVARNNIATNRGGTWCEEIGGQLYSFQTSLTSIFNYIYLKHKDCNVLMAGVDLNSAGTFYRDFPSATVLEEENSLTHIINKGKSHISLINYNGQGTILDVMDFICDKLASKNIYLYSLNPESELVLRGWARVWNG